MKLRQPQITSDLVFPVSILILIIIMIGRLRLGLVRYFDADEFMYLNWAAHISQGYRPYLDFLMHVTPVYPLVLAPLFLVGSGVAPVIAARILAWFISLILVFVVMALFYEVRRTRFAIVAGLTLAVLPIPSDKLLEIRPDILAIILSTAGYILLFSYFRKEKYFLLFGSGLLLSLGFLTMQKTAPGLAIGTGAIFIYLWQKLKREKGRLLSRLSIFVSALFLPFILLFVWAFRQGNAGLVWYSIFRLPVEHLAGVSRFNDLSWNFFFLPNSIYYGENGISTGLVVNHIIWIFALALVTVRLAGLFFIKNFRQRLTEGVIAVTAISYGAFYVWFSPLKFPQYLIPAGVFVAWYTGDWAYLVWMSVKKIRILRTAAYGLGIAGMIGSYWFNQKVNQPKFYWTNEMHLTKMQKIYADIPASEYLLDLEGRTIYYRYPHPVCCLAFGQFETYLSRPYPSYTERLEKTKTRYIYQAEIDRISALSPGDQLFIKTHYEPTENGELWVAKDW